MKLVENRTGKKIELRRHNVYCGFIADILEQHGYKFLNALDIDNCKEIAWQGIEHNCLYVKDNVVYRFNKWVNDSQVKLFKSLDVDETDIEIEEIGYLV